MRSTAAVALAVVVAAAVPALGQQRVREVRPASRDGVVEIENVAGSVRVVGWERNEVEVTGELGRGTERLEVTSSGQRTTIRVVLPRHCRSCDGSELEVRVPAGSRVDVEAVSADVEVEAVTGSLTLQSVSGEVRVTGDPSEVDASSVSGDVLVNAVSAPIRAKSVSGEVRLRGARGDIEAGSVSGDVVVEGGEIERGDFSTTSGGIRVEGELGSGARIDAKSVSGDIDLVFPAGVRGDFEVSSFSGDIHNQFGPSAQRVSKYTSEKELSFSTGAGGARVTARSFSGSIRLLRR